VGRSRAIDRDRHFEVAQRGHERSEFVGAVLRRIDDHVRVLAGNVRRNRWIVVDDDLGLTPERPRNIGQPAVFQPRTNDEGIREAHGFNQRRAIGGR
jgi:hypothetical protein